AGHVRRPGVYRLALGARVHRAIEAAGGARPGADLASINRAATVTDGQQVLVARMAPAGEAAAPAGTSAAGATATKVSLSRASPHELDALPGIGPVTAERIVAERTANGPFADVDDLDRVPGIGPATVDQLRDLVTA
ncbi:MAG: competence protein ComEA helix-hairpin-helix repeat protein, partial [Thermoleophilia bacterium]|nr:competence protein ComEA helix-hairpin-helix repeat protein [Thermoleophilia bacterium]